MARVLFLQQMLSQEMIGPMVLSRVLKDAGHETRCVFVPDQHWVAKIHEWNPHVIAISSTTGLHRTYLEMLKPLRRRVRDAVTIMGGHHPTFVPSVLDHPELDAICIGEGEGAIVDLANRIEKGEPFHDVPNLHVRKDGTIVKNPVRPLVQDLDALGIPDRDLLYDAHPFYRELDRKVFHSLRGCPYPCSFCFHPAWRSKIYDANPKEYLRRRSVDHLIREILEVRERWPLRFVHFVDDIFNIIQDWVEEFCDKYPKQVGIPFDVILRTNITSAKHMQMLKQAGCVSARLAFEAANDHIRNDVYKKHTSVEVLERSARFVREQGIRLTTLNILGAPGSSIEDDLETVRLNIRAKADHPLVSLLQPYPETDINDLTKNMGYTTDSYDEFPDRYNRTSPVKLEHRRETENLHKLFPLVVRHPWMMPMVPRLIRWHALRRIYLAAFLLYMEYLASEQLRVCKVAGGNADWRSFPLIDSSIRVVKKTILKIQEGLFGRVSLRLRLALQADDDRTLSHIE